MGLDAVQHSRASCRPLTASPLLQVPARQCTCARAIEPSSPQPTTDDDEHLDPLDP